MMTYMSLIPAHSEVPLVRIDEKTNQSVLIPSSSLPESCFLNILPYLSQHSLTYLHHPHRTVVTDLHRSLSAALKATGPSLLATDPSTMQPLTETLVKVLSKKHPCQEDFMSAESASDASDLDPEESAEYDWLVVDTALDCITALAVSLGPTFAQLFKIFEKPILRFASSSLSIERSTAVGVLAELIRSMGGNVTPSTDRLYKILLHRLTDEDGEAKSNAAFAIGLLVEKTEEVKIAQNFPEILRKLEPLLQTEEKRCCDNAAGCVSRMIMKSQGSMPLEAVLPALVEILPLKEDWEENEAVWGCLVGLCES